MPIAARCPSCGSPLSETSVLALAPVCERCGCVITETGGSLGSTSAFGINDPTITRKRVEADLAVLNDYRYRYVGMLEACKEQLNSSVDRYAKTPNPPEVLTLKPVPPLGEGVLKGVQWGLGCGTPLLCLSWWPLMPLLFLFPSANPSPGSDQSGFFGMAFFGLIWYLPFIYFHLRPRFKAIAANGDRPFENARRQKAYAEACALALLAAEPVKAAQDHRLRCQIRELDGLIRTVTEKAEDVRRLLKTL